MLVRHSCTTRNNVISRLRGRRPKSSGSSRSTWILLRSLKPSIYHCSADCRPTSSRSGGCRRCEMVRISLQEPRGEVAHNLGLPHELEIFHLELRGALADALFEHDAKLT